MDFSKEQIKLFDQKNLTSKDDVLGAIKRGIANTEQSMYGSPSEIALKRVKLNLLKSFMDIIQDNVLYDFTGTMWAYKIRIFNTGIKLYFCHCSEMKIEYENIVSSSYDAEYCILQADARMLTLCEYGAVIGVTPLTLRQWIRRGKLRTAVKFGDEWRVPEYTNVPGYGYEPATYIVNKGAEINYPEKFSFLKEYPVYTIDQDANNKNEFCITASGTSEIWKINAAEREKLELFIQMHPEIDFQSKECEPLY